MLPPDHDNEERPKAAVVVSLIIDGSRVRLIIDRANRTKGAWVPWSMVTFRDFDLEELQKLKLPRSEKLALADWIVASLVALETTGKSQGRRPRREPEPPSKRKKR